MGDSDTEKYLTGRVSGYGEGQIYPAGYPARPTYLKTVARNFGGKQRPETLLENTRNFTGKQRPETLLENRGQKLYWKTEARNFTGKRSCANVGDFLLQRAKYEFVNNERCIFDQKEFIYK